MPANTHSPWTEQRVAMLRKLAGTSNSCNEIAALLGGGLTRNAVIGKMSRLGLSTGNTKGGVPRTRSSGAKTSARTVIERSLTARARQFAFRSAPDAGMATPLAIGILDLEPHHCRWVLDTRAPTGLALYCGHTTYPGRPYCLAHCCLAYNDMAKYVEVA